MNTRRHVAAAAALCALLPLLLSAQGQQPRRITVVAKKYEFQPSRIELKAGEPVEITFQSEDAKHGFSCPDLNLPKVTYSKDHPETITVTPDKPGTYQFKCSHLCGLGHHRMKGEIVVSP